MTLLVLQSSRVTSPPLGLIFLSTPFPVTICVCSSPTMGDQISQSYETIDRVIVLYTLIIIYLDTKLEEK